MLRSDYISKLSKILEDTSKFNRVNVEEGKALNGVIHMEERIIRLLKSLEDQGEISEKGKSDLNQVPDLNQFLNQEFCCEIINMNET